MPGSTSIINIFWQAARKSLRQPAFAAAAMVMLVAAVGLNGAVASLKLHFKKQAVALARPLTDIPALLGDWLQVTRDEPLSHDMQDVLGTDKYILRNYLKLDAGGGQCAVDFYSVLAPDNAAGAALRGRFVAQDDAGRAQMIQDAMKDLTNDQRLKKLSRVRAMFPEAVVNLGVTYYTGLVDTVAHVPDRCYAASGFDETTEEDTSFPVGPKSVDVRYLRFEGNDGSHELHKDVAYYFHVDGHYERDPIKVRLSLQNLLETYGYYSKVELMTVDADRELSAGAMADFLSHAVPEFEKCYPNWQALHQPVKK